MGRRKTQDARRRESRKGRKGEWEKGRKKPQDAMKTDDG